MNGIEYCYTEGERDYRTVAIPVRFTGSPKVVGEIRPVEGGWQYFPAGQKQGGEVFRSIVQVQADLEGTTEESQQRATNPANASFEVRG